MASAQRPPRITQITNELGEIRGIAFLEHALLGANAEGNLLSAAERAAFLRPSRASELQTMPAEHQLGS